MNSFSAIKIEHYRKEFFLKKIIAILTFPLFLSSTYQWKNPRSTTIASRAKYDEFDKIARDASARVCSASRVNTVLHANTDHTLYAYRATRSFSLLFSSPLPFVFPSFPNTYAYRVAFSGSWEIVFISNEKKKLTFLIRCC